jgi:nucleotide-binding universal stress UspA family protein
MKRYETIVVGTDFSPLADIALETAMRLAERVGARHIHAVHILDTAVMIAPYPMAYTSVDMARIDEARRKNALAKLAEIRSEHFEVTREVRPGIPSRDLAQAASDIHADLIVVASHGYGALKRALLGSVASSLIRVSHCPVLVVGEHRQSAEFSTVLAAVDLSPVSRKVLSYAAGLAAPGGTVRALSLYDIPMVSADEGVLPRYFSAEEIEKTRYEREQAVRRVIAELKTDGVTIEPEVMSKAPAANVILDSAEIIGADLIAVGTSGHNAWHRMIIGATATKVLAEAKVPVLVVPRETTGIE